MRLQTDFELQQFVAGDPNCVGLNLAGRNISDAGMAYLENLSLLAVLSLHDCIRITDAGLRHIVGLTKLKWLILRGCNITDAGLRAVGKLTQLQVLNLHGCAQITDIGLRELAGLTKLVRLLLNECPRITDIAVAVFENQHPACEVMR